MKTHSEWAESVKRIAATPDKNTAAHDLERLATEIGQGDGSDLTPWHLIQTLGLSATFFEEASNPREAERVLRECLGFAREQLAQASRANADVAARLATLLIERGSEEEARQLASEALQSLATAPEPSFALEQFLTAWRKHASSRGGAV